MKSNGIQSVEAVATALRCVSHPLRLRILDYLESQGEPRTVTEIVAASAASQAIVSQHLRILRDKKVVAGTRIGSNMLYEVADTATVEPLLKYVRHCRTSDKERTF